MANEIIRISTRLSAADKRYEDLANAIGVDYSNLKMKERIELTAQLDALVAHHYGLTRDEYKYIIDTFEGFETDEKISELSKIEWTEQLIRKLNGEVRTRVLSCYDSIATRIQGLNKT